MSSPEDKSEPAVHLHVSTEPDLLRDQARKHLYEVGLYGAVNTIKQSLGATKLGLMQAFGGNAGGNVVNQNTPQNLSDVLAEVPIGSTVNYTQTATRSPWLLPLALAGMTGAAGILGGMIYNRGTPAAPAAPVLKPVDLNLEWEVPVTDGIKRTESGGVGVDVRSTTR